MTSRQRVLTALSHQAPDRTPLWLGVPKPEIVQALCAHYGVADYEAVMRRAGDDFRWAGHHGWKHPQARQPFDMTGCPRPPGECETVADVDALPWPDPQYIDVADTRAACQAARDAGFAVMGGSWAPFFHQVGWTMGQEEYFIKMHTHPEVVEAFTERIVDFYMAANDRVFEVAGDLIDFYFFGNDLGTQLGPFVSPDCFRRFILPSIRRLSEQAHRRGLHVWMHSCGSVRTMIGDFIDAGVEALHPVQVSAKGMDPAELGREFGGKILFVGGIDVHQLLRTGTPQQVRQAVQYNKKHLAPSYVVSPSHEAVLPDVKIENLLAMFEEAAKA